MIDVESLIFSQVAEALRVAFPGIFVSGEYVDTPAKFPAVTIVESDNAIVQRMRTVNTVGYKKSEAKDIMEAVDGEFSKLGFARTMCNPISNLSDATIYRMVARYTATVAKDLWVYRAD